MAVIATVTQVCAGPAEPRIKLSQYVMLESSLKIFACERHEIKYGHNRIDQLKLFCWL